MKLKHLVIASSVILCLIGTDCKAEELPVNSNKAKNKNEVTEVVQSISNVYYNSANIVEEYNYNVVPNTLLKLENEDSEYKGEHVELDSEERELLEKLVQGEAGGEGYIGAALVAQTIRDTMIYDNFDTVSEVREKLKYSGSIDKEPNDDVLRAVKYIFDDDGIAVRHRLKYFYAPSSVKSKFHESQEFVLEYNGHRFFSPIEDNNE